MAENENGSGDAGAQSRATKRARFAFNREDMDLDTGAYVSSVSVALWPLPIWHPHRPIWHPPPLVANWLPVTRGRSVAEYPLLHGPVNFLFFCWCTAGQFYARVTLGVCWVLQNSVQSRCIVVSAWCHICVRCC